MQSLKLLALGALALLVVGCTKSSSSDSATPTPTPAGDAYTATSSTRKNVNDFANPSAGLDETVIDVRGTITSNTTWTGVAASPTNGGTKYRLNGFVRVASGATLTITPGTIIVGDFTSKGTLIIQRGGQINAIGTPAQPIVFTSDARAGQRSPGNWGGVVICGAAPNNIGVDAELEGGYGGFHGGTNAADNSGIMRYVRIEFAGIALFPNQEINGLTLGSVGSGTILEWIQVSFSGDDSFEWFGGTANGKWLIAQAGIDDDFDMDNGFNGTLQWGLGLRRDSNADQSGSNGFEIDNDADGSSRTPLTNPKLVNFTVLGPVLSSTSIYNPLFQRGAHLRRNSRPQIYNSIIAGYPRGIDIDDQGSATVSSQGSAAADGVADLKVKGTLLAIVTGSLQFVQSNPKTGSTFNTQAWFNTAGFNNSAETTSMANSGLNNWPATTGTRGGTANAAVSTLPTGITPSVNVAIVDPAAVFTAPTPASTTTFRGGFNPDGTSMWANTWTNFEAQGTRY
jgi:hypothetical protein